MRSILIALVFLTIGTAVVGQTVDQKSSKPAPKKLDLSRRSADHLMIQIGMAGWYRAPDSIRTKGVGRTFNAYLLFDFPFKSNQKISAAIGAGIGTDNIYFNKTTINLINGIKATFTRDTIVQYKKYKLANGYLEIPVELRYSSNPGNMNRGFKFAVGAKLGTMLDAKTKAKVDLDADKNGGYIEKIKDKSFFNTTRLAATARIGYGHFTLFGTFTITEYFREFQGPTVKPWSLGITLSGL
jgi:Outer membrane protein beta-barrel domain